MKRNKEKTVFAVNIFFLRRANKVLTKYGVCVLIFKTDEAEVKLHDVLPESGRRWKSHSKRGRKWSVEGALKRCDGTFPLQKEEYSRIP